MNYLQSKTGTVWETVKFALRIALLVFGPQLIALATDNSGVLWADILSVTLPVLDKYVHESQATTIKGIIPF